MPILIAIVTGLVAVVTLIMMVMYVPPVLRQVRALRQPSTPLPLSQNDDCVLRGTIESDAPLHTVAANMEAVYIHAEMREQVGRNARSAGTVRRTASCTLKDEHSGTLVGIDISDAKVDCDQAVAGKRGQSPEINAFLDEFGDWRWPKTPHSLSEQFIAQGAKVLMRGEVLQESPLQVEVTYLAPQASSLWGITDLRSLVYTTLVCFVCTGATIALVMSID